MIRLPPMRNSLACAYSGAGSSKTSCPFRTVAASSSVSPASWSRRPSNAVKNRSVVRSPNSSSPNRIEQCVERGLTHRVKRLRFH